MGCVVEGLRQSRTGTWALSLRTLRMERTGIAFIEAVFRRDNPAWLSAFALHKISPLNRTGHIASDMGTVPTNIAYGEDRYRVY